MRLGILVLYLTMNLPRSIEESYTGMSTCGTRCVYGRESEVVHLFWRVTGSKMGGSLTSLRKSHEARRKL